MGHSVLSYTVNTTAAQPINSKAAVSPHQKKKDKVVAKPKASTPAKKAKKPSKQIEANLRRRRELELKKRRSAKDDDDDMSRASTPPASPVQMTTSPTTSPRRPAQKRRSRDESGDSASEMEVDDPEVAELMDEVSIKLGVDSKGLRAIMGDMPTAVRLKNILKDDSYLELLNEARSQYGELDPADLLKHTKSGRLTKQTLKNMLGKPKSPPSSPVRLLGSGASGGGGGSALQPHSPKSPPKTPPTSPPRGGTVTRDDDSIADETFSKMKTTREEVMTAFAQVGLDAATATSAQVTKAYKKLLVPLHPDRGGDKEKFQKFNRMWQLAKDYIHKYNLISKQYKQA